MASESHGSVLSDVTIHARLADLVENGTERNAREAGYEFLPGKVYPTGEGQKGMPIDWTVPDLPIETNYAVKRGELVLVRTRERVRMPADMCGLWSQLDRNSRQGLLLVNTSVVPPGYEGFLTCTFVNFGYSSRVLKPHSPIARLVFLRLDGPAREKGSVYSGEVYDRQMSDAARDAPSTFLAIAERSAELATIIDEAKRGLDEQGKKIVAGTAASIAERSAELARIIDEAKRALDEQGKTIVTGMASGLDGSLKTATEQLDTVAKAQKEKLETDATGAIKKAFPWAVLAILALALINWVSTKLVTSADVAALAKERADRIEAKITEQLGADARGKPLFVYTGTPEGKALADRLAALEEQIRVLSAKPKVP